MAIVNNIHNKTPQLVPTPTPEDNGKVPTVEGEKYVLKIPTGGGGSAFTLIREFTVPADPKADQSGITWILDKGTDTFVEGFEFNQDNTGLPFAYDDLAILVSNKLSKGSTDSYLDIGGTDAARSIYHGYKCGFNTNSREFLICTNTFGQISTPTIQSFTEYNPSYSVRNMLAGVSAFMKKQKYKIFTRVYVYNSGCDLRNCEIKVFGRNILGGVK